MRSYLTDRIRGVFVGSGSDGMQAPSICNEVIRLTRKAAGDVTVGYLGTATYDLPASREKQTGLLAAKGCRVVDLPVADPQIVDGSAVMASIAACDVIVVSGGNTLFAVGRWEKLGLVDCLREAAIRGCVMCGGSAGAICWFDAGHSDSMDPETYRRALCASPQDGDEATQAPQSAAAAKAWSYIRVHGLGFLPGLVCPHYDRTQSNGVPRREDFAAMRRRHPGEAVLCIDHWAALVVDGGSFSVVPVPEKEGSHNGVPWVFYGAPNEDAPPEPTAQCGRLADIVHAPSCVVVDPKEDICSKENPI